MQFTLTAGQEGLLEVARYDGPNAYTNDLYLNDVFVEAVPIGGAFSKTYSEPGVYQLRPSPDQQSNYSVTVTIT